MTDERLEELELWTRRIVDVHGRSRGWVVPKHIPLVVTQTVTPPKVALELFEKIRRLRAARSKDREALQLILYLADHDEDCAAIVRVVRERLETGERKSHWDGRF